MFLLLLLSDYFLCFFFVVTEGGCLSLTLIMRKWETLRSYYVIISRTEGSHRRKWVKSLRKPWESIRPQNNHRLHFHLWNNIILIKTKETTQTFLTHSWKWKLNVISSFLCPKNKINVHKNVLITQNLSYILTYLPLYCFVRNRYMKVVRIFTYKH